MSRHNITFVIFAYNEESRIKWVIDNFKEYGNVLIVDNYSADKTVEIATSNGCEILMNKNNGWVEDYETGEKVKSAVKTEWIFWGFADEMIDQNSLSFVLEKIGSGKYDVVTIKRKNYLYGRFCHGAIAGNHPKFFKKDALDFKENSIHGMGSYAVPRSRVYDVPSKYYICHFINSNISSYLSTIDRYTDIEVEQHHQKGVGYLQCFIVKPMKIFFLDFLMRRGYKAGVAGLGLVFTQIAYNFVKGLKLYERSRGLNRESIERLNDVERQRILDQMVRPFDGRA